MLKTYLVICCLLVAKSLTAQTYFERILPNSSAAKSSAGHDLIYDKQQSTYYVLCNVAEFDTASTSGTLIEGPFTIGSKISKLNSAGELIWSQLYYTNCGPYCDVNIELWGRVPAKKIALSASNTLTLPFTQYGALQICDSIPGGGSNGFFSFYLRLLQIDRNDGAITKSTDLSFEDIGCRRDEIRDVNQESDDLGLLIYDQYNENVKHISFNEELEIIDSVTLIDSQPRSIDSATDGFFSLWTDYVLFFDSEGHLRDSIFFNLPETFYYSQKKFFENEEYLAFLVSAKEYFNDPYFTLFSLFDKVNHQLIAQKTILDRKIIDAQFIDDEIVFLEDLSDGFFDPLEKPVGVGLLDAELQEMAFSNYGFPYITPKKLRVFEDGNFAILGTSIKSFIDLEDGRQSDKTYVLVDNILSLSAVGIEESTQPAETVKITPNPASKHISLELPTNTKDAKTTIYNTTGQEVWQGPSDNSGIDISFFHPGLYHFTVRTKSGKIYSGKFIKV